nr:RecQ family ATP-dependent DNA helicase [Thermospira aquatica]
MYPFQEKALDSWRKRRDMLITLPTGRGKSLCYQLPSLEQDGLTLVISPLIALMQDQVMGLTEAGVKSGYLSSLQDPEKQEKVLQEMGQYALLYVTPERLASRRFLEVLKMQTVEAVVIDEAHCVSLWGRTFRPSYRRLKDFLRQFPGARRVALSATVTPVVKRDIYHFLELRNPVEIIESPLRNDLTLHLEVRENPLSLLRRVIHTGGPGIIYTQSRYECERLAFLLSHDIPTAFYHAGMSRKERDESLRQFLANEVQWMVATSAFGMGIDKSDIRTVVHLDPPPSLEDYLQQIGRASRDGKGGKAYLFLSSRILLRKEKEYRPRAGFVIAALLRGKWELFLRKIYSYQLWRAMLRWIGSGLSSKVLMRYFEGKSLKHRGMGLPFSFLVGFLQGQRDDGLLFPGYGVKRGFSRMVFERWFWRGVRQGNLCFDVRNGEFWVRRGERQ